MAGRTSTPGASVTSRALALLGAFDEKHRRLTLTELAERADLPVPTAHRLVAELVEWGALARADDGRYVVGRRLWDLGLLAPVQTGLRQLASPYLHDLYGATLATVHLAVRDDLEVLYVDRLSGHASVPVVSQIGSRLPIHATGVGKVLLAHAPADVQARVLGATAGPPDAVHRSPSRDRCAASSPECCATTTRPRSRRCRSAPARSRCRSGATSRSSPRWASCSRGWARTGRAWWPRCRSRRAGSADL